VTCSGAIDGLTDIGRAAPFWPQLQESLVGSVSRGSRFSACDLSPNLPLLPPHRDRAGLILPVSSAYFLAPQAGATTPAFFIIVIVSKIPCTGAASFFSAHRKCGPDSVDDREGASRRGRLLLHECMHRTKIPGACGFPAFASDAETAVARSSSCVVDTRSSTTMKLQWSRVVRRFPSHSSKRATHQDSATADSHVGPPDRCPPPTCASGPVDSIRADAGSRAHNHDLTPVFHTRIAVLFVFTMGYVMQRGQPVNATSSPS